MKRLFGVLLVICAISGRFFWEKIEHLEYENDALRVEKKAYQELIRKLKFDAVDRVVRM